ncbi:hypothetical protein CLAIMM_12540, partial [Cladophialophora immunda]
MTTTNCSLTDQSSLTMLAFAKSIATIRGDLSNITAPPFVLDTKSTVELPSFWAERPSTFVAPAAADDPAERALLVLKWFLSSLRNQQYGGRSPVEGVKKPINAFLGELFLARWDGDQVQDQDGAAGDRIGVTRLSSPARHGVSSLERETRRHGRGYTRQEITFSGSVNIQQIGHATLHLARHDETYLIPLPDIKIKGVLTGSPYPELQGTHHIPSTSGYTSIIEFSGKGLFSGSDRKHGFEASVYRNAGEGEGGGTAADDPIYTVSGHWDGQFVIRDARRQENVVELETFDVTTATTTPLVTDPVAEQDPWESRRAWRGVREALQRADMQAAADAKARVENGQREMRKADGEGRDWERLFFEPVARLDEVAASLAQKVGLALSPNPGDKAAAWRFRRRDWEGGRFRKPYHGDLMPDNSHAGSDKGGRGGGTVVNGANGVPVPPPVADPQTTHSHTHAEEERHVPLKQSKSTAQPDAATTPPRPTSPAAETGTQVEADTKTETTSGSKPGRVTGLNTSSAEREIPAPAPAERETDDSLEQEDMTARDKIQVEEFLRD